MPEYDLSVNCDELYHYGVKGMKWGVRRYQYADGTRTPAGIRRYGKNKESEFKSKARQVVNSAKTKLTGKQYVDGYLNKRTTFSRIQTSKDFENHAFYATYKKQDSNKYMGLFGKNLKSRANADAKNAEKKAEKTGDIVDINKAKELRTTADNMKIYQLKINSIKKLKIPSDENASHITANLLKEKDFRENTIASIQYSKSQMKRPTQQILFNQAQKALNKDPSHMSSSEKVAVYKALNLSLTFHNKEQIAVQNRFYSELKKKGYNALLDYNDKEFSSYHAKRPMIVFDMDSVKLQSVAETNPKIVNRLYTRYNAERISKEVLANTIGYVSKLGNKSLSECEAFVNNKVNNYLQ